MPSSAFANFNTVALTLCFVLLRLAALGLTGWSS